MADRIPDFVAAQGAYDAVLAGKPVLANLTIEGGTIIVPETIYLFGRVGLYRTSALINQEEYEKYTGKIENDEY